MLLGFLNIIFKENICTVMFIFNLLIVLKLK